MQMRATNARLMITVTKIMVKNEGPARVVLPVAEPLPDPTATLVNSSASLTIKFSSGVKVTDHRLEEQ